MTPTEKLVIKVVRDERAKRRTNAIKPAVQARTGVSDATYWRAIRLENYLQQPLDRTQEVP